MYRLFSKINRRHSALYLLLCDYFFDRTDHHAQRARSAVAGAMLVRALVSPHEGGPESVNSPVRHHRLWKLLHEGTETVDAAADCLKSGRRSMFSFRRGRLAFFARRCPPCVLRHKPDTASILVQTPRTRTRLLPRICDPNAPRPARPCKPRATREREASRRPRRARRRSRAQTPTARATT